jgi:hypothetical protein
MGKHHGPTDPKRAYGVVFRLPHCYLRPQLSRRPWINYRHSLGKTYRRPRSYPFGHRLHSCLCRLDCGVPASLSWEAENRVGSDNCTSVVSTELFMVTLTVQISVLKRQLPRRPRGHHAHRKISVRLREALARTYPECRSVTSPRATPGPRNIRPGRSRPQPASSRSRAPARRTIRWCICSCSRCEWSRRPETRSCGRRH